METNLLPISQIVKIARQQGVTFGHGDPKIHLAYLTKLRLLPQAIRRKIGNKIVGCYPEYVTPLLQRIEKLKEAGLTYSQIKFQLQSQNMTIAIDGGRLKAVSEDGESKIETEKFYPQSSIFNHHLLPFYHPSSSNAVAFLIIGLLLGYLLAINKPALPIPSSQSPVSSTISPLDDQSQTMVRMITSKSSRDADPIYLIAVPQKNLYRLGQMNISSLIKSQ